MCQIGALSLRHPKHDREVKKRECLVGNRAEDRRQSGKREMKKKRREIAAAGRSWQARLRDRLLYDVNNCSCPLKTG